MFKNIAIITPKDSWFAPYAVKLAARSRAMGFKAGIFSDHRKTRKGYDVAFILSYTRLADKKFLLRNRHNIVVHASRLPRGKGWSPLFWQILEGKNRIPVTLFEAAEGMDAGDVYLRSAIDYKGHELNAELRNALAKTIISLCIKFLAAHNNLKPKKQKGRSTFYKRRTPEDSRLDINKSIKEQFDLLRVVDNEAFPAFFRFRGHRYTIKIFKDLQRKK